MSDYVSGLRQDLVEAAARQQAAGRGARAARPLRPRAWSPVVVLGAAAALAAALVLVVGLRAVTPPRPPEALKVVGGFHIEAQPSDAVAAGGYVIVGDDGGRLLQIDPRTEEQHQITPQRRRAGGARRGRRHRVGRDRAHRPRLARARPCCNSTRRAAGGSPPSRCAGEGRSLAIGAGGLWVQTARTTLPTHPDSLERVDPRTHRRTASSTADRIGEPRRVARFGLDAQRRDSDPARRPRPHRQPRAAHLARDRLRGQRSIVADADGAWVVGQSDGLLYRIENGHVVKRIRVGGLGGAIARTRSAVWVTALVAADRFAARARGSRRRQA